MPGLVVLVLHLGTEDHHAGDIDGASPLTPLTWLVLLAGWSHLPTVQEGQMHVEVQSRQGVKVQLTEKLHQQSLAPLKTQNLYSDKRIDTKQKFLKISRILEDLGDYQKLGGKSVSEPLFLKLW